MSFERKSGKELGVRGINCRKVRSSAHLKRGSLPAPENTLLWDHAQRGDSSVFVFQLELFFLFTGQTLLNDKNPLKALVYYSWVATNNILLTFCCSSTEVVTIYLTDDDCCWKS